MLLEGKTAVIYGGGGSAGGAVARAFAREGATVHVTGHAETSVQAVVDDITAAGGRAHAAAVDALDQAAVDAHADEVAAAGSLDISFNAIAHGDVQGTPLAEMPVDDFLQPVLNGLRTSFFTAQAAARHMVPQGSGVILAFGGTGDPVRNHFLGGLQTGLTAIFTFHQQLATELGPKGVRVVTLRTGGVIDSLPDEDWAAPIVEELEAMTLTGRGARTADVGNAAVFAASEWGQTLTATQLNISAGAIYG